MGLQFNQYLNGSCIYGCKECKTHLANWEDIMSKNFRGRQGDAYLFKNVHDEEERDMLTGKYTVQDISCRHCNSLVGWTYVKSHEEQERYKEGKFILEVKALTNVK